MEDRIDLNALISKEIPCECGRTHFSSVKRIDIGPDAVLRLPDLIRELGYCKVFLAADSSTMAAAGEKAAEALRCAGIPFEQVILSGDEVIPNELAVGELMTAFPLDTDLVLGVGSGTVNDLCKFLSHRMRVDYMILASAPSMDGFVSIGSALMLSHVKTTLDCQGPVAVIGDTGILAAAPMRLIGAGLGDTLGKYTCLLDWKLSQIINGEYWCGRAAGMVGEALRAVLRQASVIPQRDPEGIAREMEALVLTGIAMSYVGNSRPASGCEHHFSHYWEMKALLEGRTPALHGEQVAVGTILALKLYHDLAEEEPDFKAAKNRPYDRVRWESEIRKVYGDAAEGIIRLEDQCRKNDIGARSRRIENIQSNWPMIRDLIRSELPETEEIIGILRSIGAPVHPEMIGVSLDDVRSAVLYAKEVRSRYTLLQLLWDLGLSEKYADAAESFFRDLKTC